MKMLHYYPFPAIYLNNQSNTNLFEMMLHNYLAIFMNCTARYLILSTIINF